MKLDEMAIFPDTKIFIICPAEIKTGGTEVIHQLANILQNYIETYICYINLKKPIIPKEFKNYNCKHILHLENLYDNAHNIIIVPETHTRYLFKLKKVQKILWWLSVDNYLNGLDLKKEKGIIERLLHAYLRNDQFIFKLHRNKIIHLVQSEYARQFVSENGVKTCYYLSDYINEKYIKESKELDSYRENIVLYNPKKGYEFTKKIIERLRNIQCIPIINMSNEEIINLMKRSKVYIDFGNHPGKDRLPREAAMMGLCIITGKKGAARNDMDLCIPNKYKYSDEMDNIDDIIKRINMCIIDFDIVTCDFDEYRSKIKNEKQEFQNCVKRIFKVRCTEFER